MLHLLCLGSLEPLPCGDCLGKDLIYLEENLVDHRDDWLILFDWVISIVLSAGDHHVGTLPDDFISRLVIHGYLVARCVNCLKPST